MEAMQCSDVHSLEDGAAEQTMDTLLEENRESSFVENVGHSLNAEVVAGMFAYLPGFVDGTQESFSENSGINMLTYPQMYNPFPSSQTEIAANNRQSVYSAKFDDLEMGNDNLMLVENNTGKIFAGIAFEAMPEHEELIMKTACETSGTILVPSKCPNEHSAQEITSWAPESAIFQHANEQDTFLQETGQLELPGVLKSLHPLNGNTDESENANYSTCLQKPVVKTHFQLEENTNKHYEGDHRVHLVRDDSSSKQHTEEHEIDEGFSILKEPDCVALLQSEENTSTYPEQDQHVNMGRAVISSKQHTEKHENDEEFLILGAVRKPDLVVIRAYVSDRKEDSETVDQPLHVSMKVDVKADKFEGSPEKLLEREEQCVSFNVSDNASRRHTEECINDGKSLILKALNNSDGGIKEDNLRDGEKPYADTSHPHSTVSEGDAEMLQKAYHNSNEFNIGDLVWAKVRSHPWWPAQVFDPAHASEAAKKLEQPGRVLIAFFGDRTFGWLQKSQLIAFQPNFKKKVKQTVIKTFCKGVTEALDEFCKLSELALICQHYKGSLHSLSTPLYGHSGNVNGVNAKHCTISLENAERVKPAKTLEFIKCMACNPFGSCHPTLEAAELRGHAYGFRACMVALSTTDLSQKMQAAETPSVHHNRQKRKSNYVDLCTEADVQAEEVKKKVKTSETEDDAETLLALACYHPKLLKRLGKKRSTKDLQCHPATKNGYSQTGGQIHDLEPISGSKSSNKLSIMATTNVCYERRKKSEAQDVFSFTPESEENLSEAGIQVPKRRKKSSNVKAPKLTRSKQSEAKKQFNLLSLEGLDGSNSSEVEKQRETMVNNSDMRSSSDNMVENKGNRFSRLGYCIRKVAIELASTPPPLMCVDGSSKKIIKLRSKKKINGLTAKTMSSSKHDNAVFQASPSDEFYFSKLQLYQSLKLLAMDPLNKADTIMSPIATKILLRFRTEVVNTKDIAEVLFDDVGKHAEVSLEDAQIGVEEAGEAVKDILKDDQLSKALDTSAGWNASGEYFARASQKGKQIMLAGDTVKDALEGDQISKVLENSSNWNAFLNESFRGSSQATRKGKQILFEEAGGAAKYDLGDQISEAFKSLNELPNEHSKDSFQAEPKVKSKVAVAKSSRKCSTSTPRERLCSPAAESREPMEPRSFQSNEDPFPGKSAPTASNTGSLRQRNYKKLSAPLQLGIFMQFPQDFTLPLEAQLKAMFVQFGPVPPSGVRVFKDLASAQVVFTHGEDAKAAYKHAKKTAMFGHASVTYKLCQFSFSDNWKKTRAFLRANSSRSHERVPCQKDEHVARCFELATSLKERVDGHLRAVTESSRKRTNNGQARTSSTMQQSRNCNTRTNHRSSDPLGDILQERMMTLIRRVSVIVGTPNVTPNTK